MSGPKRNSVLKTGKTRTHYLVVMGIAGTGKTEIGKRLATALGAGFVEADDYHSDTNIELMRSGTGLTDEHRWPWLHSVCDAALTEDGCTVVIACSVLKRSYRDLLRDRLGSVRFLYLHGSLQEISARLSKRRDHFASTSLLESQIEALEPPSRDEDAIVLEIADTPERIVQRATSLLADSSC
jgi:gluconokinase